MNRPANFAISMARIISISALLIASGCGGGGGSGGNSGGGTMVSVPNVVGDTQAAATTSITGAGLALGAVTMQSSSSVASGDVISENPTAGASVAKGSAVALVVSSGPAMVAVPNVVGNAQAAATAAITGAGLTLGTVSKQSSNTVPSGNVISESPAAGTSVASGSAVALVVSSGPATGAHTLGGIVIGLAGGVTVQVLNGADDVPVTANGPFTFPTKLTSGASYAVSVGTPQPTGQTCAVQNGSGTAGSADITNVVVYCTVNVTPATLKGAYTAVKEDLSRMADELDSVTFTGMGGYTGSAIVNTNGVISNPALSGIYTVTQDQSTAEIPVLTVNGTDTGAMEFNADAVALLVNAAGGTPGLYVGVKQAQNASISTVNGTYTNATLESTVPASGSLSSITVSNGTGTFGAAQRNTNGTITTVPGGTGTYTVTAGGAITFGTGGAGISGAISADGDLVVLAPTTSNGNGSTPGIYVAVKQGTGVTTATLNGVYTLVSLSTSSAAGTVGRYYSVGVANGAFAGAYVENNAGTSSASNAVSGTYTAADDGAMTAVVTGATGPLTLTGAMSADGNVFVLADVTSGEAATLLVGLRQ
jgi:hypothetical protein